MLGIKRKELENQLEFYKAKVEDLTKELSFVNSSNYKYKRLFSQLFDRLQFTGVSRYKVDKDLTDGKVLFNIEYNDGNSYVYDVKLVYTGYEEILKGELKEND
jgi:hypothetical protein